MARDNLERHVPRVKKMLASGSTRGQIAESLGVPVSAVQRLAREHGLTSPPKPWENAVSPTELSGLDDVMTPEDLALLVRRLLFTKDIRQYAIAREMGLPPQQITDALNRPRAYRGTLVRLAELLGLTVETNLMRVAVPKKRRLARK